jgi:tetratricopeptide (TPR) repeat protein
VSLALWVVASNLLLRVLTALGLSGNAALIATCAYALHPIQVEAVSWATGRKDVLALLLSCCAVLAHLRAARGSDRHAWLARIAYLLAALSKTSVLPLPALLLLADVCLRRRSLRQAITHQLPSLALGAGLGVYVIVLWRGEQMLRESAAKGGASLNRVVATLGHQLGTALWPSSISPMYSTEAVTSASTLSWLACGSLLAAGWTAWRCGAGRALFSLGAFALLLLPVSNAIPMYFPYQDRYLSLPLFGLCFGLGAALDATTGAARRGAITLAVGLVLALALRCVQYQGAWQSELRLWGHAVRTQPDAYYASLKLGEVRRRAGDLYGAIRAYQQLLRIDPRRKQGHAALLEAVALRDEKLRGLAPSRAELYAKSYYDALDDADALRALSARMLQSGHVRALELPLGRALQLRPVPDDVLEHAAMAQLAQGQPSVALFYVRQLRRPTQDAALRTLADDARRRLTGAPIL